MESNCAMRRGEAVFVVIFSLIIGSTVLSLTIIYGGAWQHSHYHESECLVNSCTLVQTVCCRYLNCQACYNLSINITLVLGYSTHTKLIHDLVMDDEICQNDEITCYYDDSDMNHLKVSPFPVTAMSIILTILASIFMIITIIFSVSTCCNVEVTHDKKNNYDTI